MDTVDEFLHIKKSDLKRDYNIIFLVIPAIVFAIALAFLFNSFHKYSSMALTTQENSAVLGETDNNP